MTARGGRCRGALVRSHARAAIEARAAALGAIEPCGRASDTRVPERAAGSGLTEPHQPEVGGFGRAPVVDESRCACTASAPAPARRAAAAAASDATAAAVWASSETLWPAACALETMAAAAASPAATAAEVAAVMGEPSRSAAAGAPGAARGRSMLNKASTRNMPPPCTLGPPDGDRSGDDPWESNRLGESRAEPRPYASLLIRNATGAAPHGRINA